MLTTVSNFIFQAANVPVTFEMFFLSEIQHALSAPLDAVANSIATNGICLKVCQRLVVKFKLIIFEC